MTTPALVSVVIPVFNGREYILQALETALTQTVAEVEILVVDDGSTDGTPSLIVSHPDPRITLLEQSNAGPSVARNRGIRHATGKYVAFLDSDDLWEPGKLESQLNALEAETGARWVYSSAITTDFLTGEVLSQHPATLRGDSLCTVLRRNIIGSPSVVMAERTLLLEVGGFDESIGYAEDWELWARLAASSPLASAVPVGVSIRRRGDSYGADSDKMRADSLRVLEKAFGSYARRCAQVRPAATAWVHYLAGLGLRYQNHRLRALGAFGTAIWHRPFWTEPYISLLATVTPRFVRTALKRFTRQHNAAR